MGESGKTLVRLRVNGGRAASIFVGKCAGQVFVKNAELTEKRMERKDSQI